MPSKRGSKTSNASKYTSKNEKSKKKEKISHTKNNYDDNDNDNDNNNNNNNNNNDEYDSNEDYDTDEFQNSEDDYVSQSGGDSDEGGDSTIDLDPDDEEYADLNEDETYDPVTEFPESVDSDEEIEKEVEEDEEIDEAELEEEAAAEEENEELLGEAKPCHMKNLNKDFIVLDEDDSNIYGKMEYKKIADQDRISDPIMTYYEMVRIIGTRAQQFNFGAEPLVKGLEGLHPAKMAYLELIAKMTPFIVRRHLPSKRYEDWHIDELEIIHVISDDFFVPEKFNWEALMKQASKINSSSEIIHLEEKSKTKPLQSTKKNNSKKNIDSKKSDK